MIYELFCIIIGLLILLIWKQVEICKLERELDYYRYEQGIEDLDNEEDFYNGW